MMTPRLPLILVLATALLTLAVIGLGAYVRLSDAGLGCPDWPGCYGAISPHHAADAIAAAHAQQPDGPVSPAKAWKEMLHRYLASALGLAILLIAALAWRRERGLNRGLALGLLGLVILQGLLGMWTVTLALRPAIVSAHLLGGMATLALLVWLATRLEGWPTIPLRALTPPPAAALALLAKLALAAVLIQIGLGGWVSSHHAALACGDFPTCGGAWWPAADWVNAFRLDHDPDAAANAEARIAMHWAHRLGAVLVMLAVAVLGLRLMLMPGFVALGGNLLGLLLIQASLGIVNVLASLPLPVAVAHNLGAALLLASLVRVNVRLRRAR
jgi:cytochrome c oxidase assembly protein subunit 15